MRSSNSFAAVRLAARALLKLTFALALLAPASAWAADLQISGYDWSPDPVANGAVTTFQVRATNNGPGAVNDAVVTVAISPRFTVTAGPGAFPTYCTLGGGAGAQVLTCNLPSFAVGDHTFTYEATASSTGSANTTASISSVSAADPNAANDSLIVTPAVQNGADLTVVKDDGEPDDAIPAGGVLSYTLNVNNAGPNATNAVRLTDNLPAASDFQYQSASGSGWSCAHNAGQVVCTYSGAAIIGNYPTVTVTGTVRAAGGTVTNNAFADLTAPTVLDPDTTNNSAVPVVTSILPGTDLRADKAMPANMIEGDAVNVTLTIVNNGPVTATGATIVDAFAGNFTLGTLPAGCAAVGQTVTCTAGALASGASQAFVIPVTATTATGGTAINSATVSPPAGLSDPVSSNDTDGVTYQITPVSADLSLAKTKGPNPVQAGQDMTSTITIRNNGPSVLTYGPGAPLRVTDAVGADESFVSAPAPWSCAQAGNLITCDLEAAGTLNVNQTRVLALVTRAGPAADGSLNNTACTGGSGGSLATPSDLNAANDCNGAGTRATPDEADLTIVKEVSLDLATWTQTPALAVPESADSFFVRLRVSNIGGDTARTVVVTDTLPNAMNVGGFVTAVTTESATQGAPSYTASNSRISWTVSNLAPGATETAVLRISRPMESGTYNNVATVTSPDTTETSAANNSSTASYTLAPIADIQAASKNITPNPAQTGVLATYTISVRNNGPNPAAGVTLTDTIDPTRFELVGAPTTAKSGAVCTKTDATGEIACTLGSFNRNQAFQVSQQVRARFPFGGATGGFPISHTNTATVATTTVESNAANNSASVTHDVVAPGMDLAISKQEPGPEFDPIKFGDELTYDIRLSNFGPSRASNVLVTDIPQPPAGYGMTLAGWSVNPVAASGGFTLYTPPAPDCVTVGANVECRLHGGDPALNYLDPLRQVIFRLRFTPTGTAPEGTLTFTNGANVVSLEQDNTTVNQADSQLANNSALQTTTVLPSTDLEVVSKTRVTPSPAAINQPVEFAIVIRNNGVSPTPQVRVTDQLPAGFVLAGPAPVAVASGAASVSNISCTGTSTVLCVLDGAFPPSADPVTITLFARAAYPFNGSLDTDLTNTATIAVGRDSGGQPLARDDDPTNNAKTAVVQIGEASIAGLVYVDNDRDDTVDAGEARPNVTVTLSGTDLYGDPVPARAVQTDATGAFLIDRLPPGTYQLVETQPAGLFDLNETAGSAGGAVNNAAYGGGAATNTISGVTLTAGAAATGYVFQEVQGSAVEGYIYSDLDNDGAREAGEAGYPPSAFAATPHVRLTGQDYGGAAVNLTATVDTDGRYSFDNVPPSDATGYTVTQLVQPTNASDGLDANGAGAVVAGSGGRAAPEGFPIGVLLGGQTLTERNFGELLTSSLTGMVFFDPNSNATRDPSETTGLAGALLRLTGTNDVGAAVDCTLTTAADGTYSFPNAADATEACRVLRPGTYAIALTPPPGLTHTGAFIGSAGGTAGGVSGANTAAPGAGNTTISNVVVGVGASLTGYDFGQTGQGISGFVYVDRNNSGVRDAGEPGIPGVTITLSGQTGTGQDVCGFIGCTATTDPAGVFTFLSAPGSDATGYTLTEQAQTSAPLSAFADGLDAAGGVGGSTRGSAGNDVISGIVLGASEFAANYAFGERAGALGGLVYIDLNDDGARQPAESPLPGVTVTLSGTTALGQDICAYRAALSPAATCVATTAADGGYRFEDLPAGVYTVTEQHPTAYADGRETAGSAGGVVNNGAFGGDPATNAISGVTLAQGMDSTGNLFGERAIAILGRVFKDAERDGADGGDEPGIPGVTINLRQGGAIVATTTTGPDGGYRFDDLPAGTYTVEEVQPAGYGSSSPETLTANLTAGVVQRFDFADTVSSLAGHVFVDSSDDGVRQAGEAPIEGVAVRLTGTDAAGAPVDRTTTTDADGEFRFDDLLAGTYTLTETQPTAYADGPDSAGSAGGVVADDAVSGIVLPVSTDATDYGFGERGRAIGGRVYVDNDDDGVEGAGDRPIPNVVIELRTPAGVVVATTTTDADGAYSFADIKGGDYVIVETQPAGYGDGRENPTNRVEIAIAADQAAEPVNFGERTGSLSGLVYNDANDDGARGPTEPVIAGVTVTLTGTDLHGQPVSRTAVTGADGTYVFADLPGGTYALVETQPAGFNDGRDTPGSAGGVASGDTISGIVLGAASNAVGYLFGERGDNAELSGTVWLDHDHDRVLDSGEPTLADWTVELLYGGQAVAVATTGADGAYQFTGLAPGGGYDLRFRHPNGTVFAGANPNEDGQAFAEGVISSANPGGARVEDGELRGLTLLPGANIAEQSLPLDPSGVVYDAVRRVPVPGAVVQISGPAGFDPAVHLLGGSANVVQTVGELGIYQFWLQASAPAGVYTLAVTPPNGTFNPIQPSTLIPPCPGPLAVGPVPAPLLVSTNNSAPPLTAAGGCATGVNSTAYFLSFQLTPGVSADVINNHIPLDPILEGAIQVTKTTPMVNVSRGGLVPYTITARNTLAGTITGITVTDRLPAGFRYREGSARIDGEPTEPVSAGRLLAWPGQTFAAGQEKRIDLILVVGAGVPEGEHVNEAYAVNAIVDAVVSNRAEATVRLLPDPDFDCTDILGKVFNDRNANGVQDEGEPGLGGVRLATARGLLVTTDAEGRYHITCPMIANEDRGSNFVIKLDERTLPTGYRPTTNVVETVRLTRGKFATLNFGAGVHRVVRLDLGGEAFDGEAIRPEYEARIDDLVATLAEAPSVLRLAYAAEGEDQRLVRRRLDAVKGLVERAWAQARDRYRLVIEEEVTVRPAPQQGGVQ
jgi:uncharacterized repeat protein (TIGR01451 family)